MASLGSDRDPSFTEFLTTKYWNHLAIQLGHWNPMRVIVMDQEMFNLMPDHTKMGVLREMQNFLKEDAMYVRDPNNCRVLILGPRKSLEPEVTMVGETPIWDPKKKHVVPEETDTKIPRPPNAYILYRRDHHNAVKEANPGMHNNDISVVTGAMWKAESAEVRAKYQAMAEFVKDQLMVKHPSYRYNPRKSHEIRRRNTGGNHHGPWAGRFKGRTSRASPRIADDSGFDPRTNKINPVTEVTYASSAITDAIPGSQRFLIAPGTQPTWNPFDQLPTNPTTGFELPNEHVVAEKAVTEAPVAINLSASLGDVTADAPFHIAHGDNWGDLNDFTGNFDDVEEMFLNV
ncbi:mat a-1 [Cladorrhinum samala]|uniref:Mat a-1 n=1 Tax=Cladorrhinum samala TaxID=585594 RepID=A0AAV9I505_9PEZI|nr:mat a-1 [Cladorrhinum samala]